MDIRKISTYVAELLLGNAIGLLLLIWQWLVLWLTEAIISWWLLVFVIHMLNAQLGVGLLSVVCRTLIDRKHNPALRRARVADLSILFWLVFSFWYVWFYRIGEVL